MSIGIHKELGDVTLEDIHHLYHLDETGEFGGIDIFLFEEAKERLKNDAFDEVHPKMLRLYRAVSVPYTQNPISTMLDRSCIGDSWTYHIDSAHIMRNQYKEYGDTFIYEMISHDFLIDWVSTVALHMIPVRGSYEREIRMKPEKVVLISNIYDEERNSIVNPNDLRGIYFLTKTVNK